jgi:hypothetical protein
MNCLHCDKKIRWLKRPVEGLYCSEPCRDEAHEESLRALREEAARQEAEFDAIEADFRASERERLEIEAALLRGRSEIVLRPGVSGTPCPACNGEWTVMQGGGSFGKSLGRCGQCDFRAEFLSVDGCPNCRCHSLVVESEDDARCPRCKSRPRRRRQIA